MAHTLKQRTDAELTALEAEIEAVSQNHDLQLREWPVEVLLHKFNTGRQEDDAEIFIPDYQRDFIWRPAQQSRFIESLFMGLPIPPLFFGFSDDPNHRGAMEVIDGTQRLRTLDFFVSNKLKLIGLEKIKKLNGYTYDELPKAITRIFKAKAIRAAVLNTHLNADARREMFDRLNSGGTRLQPMEQRRGHSSGKFLSLIEELSKDKLFASICPLPKHRASIKDREEMVLRFFAYRNAAHDFSHEVAPFLTKYLKERNEELEADASKSEIYAKQFTDVINFVHQNFPGGFRKELTHSTVPMVRFEAIAVGAALALKENSELTPARPVETWLNGDEFKVHVRSDATNSRPKLYDRIWFVRDNLLGRIPETFPRDRQADNAWKKKRISDLTLKEIEEKEEIAEWKNLDLF